MEITHEGHDFVLKKQMNRRICNVDGYAPLRANRKFMFACCVHFKGWFYSVLW